MPISILIFLLIIILILIICSIIINSLPLNNTILGGVKGVKSKNEFSKIIQFLQDNKIFYTRISSWDFKKLEEDMAKREEDSAIRYIINAWIENFYNYSDSTQLKEFNAEMEITLFGNGVFTKFKDYIDAKKNKNATTAASIKDELNTKFAKFEQTNNEPDAGIKAIILKTANAKMQSGRERSESTSSMASMASMASSIFSSAYNYTMGTSPATNTTTIQQAQAQAEVRFKQLREQKIISENSEQIENIKADITDKNRNIQYNLDNIKSQLDINQSNTAIDTIPLSRSRSRSRSVSSGSERKKNNLW